MQILAFNFDFCYIRFVVTLQTDFINVLKLKVKPNVSFADEMSRLLNISADSAYRRIRCETDLSLNEAKILADYYKVSLQNLFNAQQRDFGFVYRAFDRKTISFERYLTYLVEDLKAIQKASEKNIVYCAKDVPIFHHFNFPELAAFKIFYWMKQVLQLSKYKEVCFSESLIEDKFIELGQKANSLYSDIPSTEIWTEDTLNSTLKQIAFFHRHKLISTTALTLKLIDGVAKMIEHIQNDALKQHKESNHGLNPKGASFRLVFSDMPLNNNAVYVKTDSVTTTYITHNTLNILSTSNPDFCRETHFYTENLIHNSTLKNEPHRDGLSESFKHIFNSIHQFKSKIT